MDELKRSYPSPRWSSEIADCCMPMSFDTYSKCSYNCLYCFAFFQKANWCAGYFGEKPRCVNIEKVRRLFDSALRGDPDSASKEDAQFFPYIQDRRIMQWGGLADPFDEWERRYGVTLELLRYFDSIDYPLSFSTKAAWWTRDDRYMDLFRRHSGNWHVKLSIITANEQKARAMEKGVPAPSARLDAIRRLADAGVHVTLRLRPFIIGVSTDYRDLIARAADAGADSMTTEFFCMESRASPMLMDRYRRMSEVCGFDIYQFYRAHSWQSGLRRLNRAIKAPMVHDMRDAAHSAGMRFHVSDAFCRECNDAPNCCGVPPEWNASMTGNIGAAILAARDRGEVAFGDIRPQVERYFSFPWSAAAGFNTGSNARRARYYNATMAGYLRENWNTPSRQTSPAREYGGILVPARRDENGDIVYRYALGKDARGDRED